MKVTNNSKAMQGVYSASGVVYVLPGQSLEVDLTPEGHKGASRLKFLSIEGDVPESKSDDKAELLAKLKALGIEAGKNSGIETLQKRLAEAEAAAEKQKIIDELTELQVEFDKEANLEALQAALAAAKA
ncbi:hypothetical protein [Pseudomonas syringae]|uniref:hypothetical protein n=1 Tax=Pseudomonas syringae TaxID=317 RepID=UPI000A1ECDAE|nr:hypothetical protein [Pseudomonas syringae]OSN39556.1 hypothetical protein BV342_01267 [Pseudomonas syringae pv. actinidiae]OSR62597.1 hypothetical protein BV325_01635 [Pseudomonas syringae pv. actinidiae]OSR79924.1 hypothetical protein BV328_01621 [Pseudomonas syringae pv. actinidiae]